MAVFVLVAGCSPKSGYVYKPNPPMAGERKLPVKVAVLPFEDGTENFTKRGSALGDGKYNLAKAGISGGMSAMPPAFWGKSFADELAASGSFQSARFIYSPTEIVPDEAFTIDGILKKVNFAATFDYENEIQVIFRATRKSDKKLVWEKEVARAWKTPRNVYAGCGMGMQCMFDKMYGDWNKWMSGALAEARTDLVAAIASPPESGSGSAGAGAPPAQESVDQTIDRIFKGK
ncbi:MAG: hypothetical protein AB1346_10900 [Thermodesulfobacteriota bacterium]